MIEAIIYANNSMLYYSVSRVYVSLNDDGGNIIDARIFKSFDNIKL